MSQLRHLSLDWNYLNQHESRGKSWILRSLQYMSIWNQHESRESWILRNLQCLSGWNPLSCTLSVFRRLPNVKKLQICGVQEDYIRSNKNKAFHHLCYLDQVKELKFKIRKMVSNGRPLYPTSFTCTRLPWDDLGILGKLPKLEALKLGYDACIGTDWIVGDDGFPNLKLLRLKHLYLHHWRANSDHFPRLERLVVNCCWSMYWIPLDFAEITTLQLIDISDSAKTVGNSAKKIQQKIEDTYGSSVVVRIS
uniref:Late blight resistance protein homolog R1A-3 n=1 Tax=Nicotiana tabacum TaxID=4097 RepID=A0A1S4BPM8_TOBAC|nr:PREDICTED: putative late blight resistance protein homolog R1A-3 [Nicotiana tabacum]